MIGRNCNNKDERLSAYYLIHQAIILTSCIADKKRRTVTFFDDLRSSIVDTQRLVGFSVSISFLFFCKS
jgi:hypothetical protein